MEDKYNYLRLMVWYQHSLIQTGDKYGYLRLLVCVGFFSPISLHGLVLNSSTSMMIIIGFNL